jgi:protein SCO1/2
MNTMTEKSQFQFKIARLVQKKSFWLFFCLFFFFYPIYRSVNRELPQELPRQGQVPNFKFVDENNAAFGSDELHGKVYIASFFFSSCPSTCPEILTKMQKIQHRVRGVGQKVALISFTVDPEVDKPALLFKKAREYGANPYIWKFLTSDLKNIQNLLVDGFKVPVGDRIAGKDTSVYDIVHSERFILVDHVGIIRGYYTSDQDSINRLMIDVGLLINRDKFTYKDNKES